MLHLRASIAAPAKNCRLHCSRARAGLGAANDNRRNDHVTAPADNENRITLCVSARKTSIYIVT
jgi:hypothetical protein